MAISQTIDKLIGILQRYANVPPKEALVLREGLDEQLPYATEAELLADATQPDGAIAYALDTGVYYFRSLGLWKPSANPVGGLTYPKDTTTPALSFPVDYNDGTAVDPPSGTVFTTQAEITAFLAAAGTSNFKHLMACWDACPSYINHTIDFVLAPGIHRPRSPENAPSSWYFGSYRDKPKLFGPNAFIRVAPASFDGATWTEIVAAQTIVTDNMGAAGNPNIVVSGTPYTPGALKGYFVWFGTWGHALIHDNTADTIYLTTNPGYTITPGVTTATVISPGVILRNSLNDTSAAKSKAFQLEVPSQYGVYLNQVRIEAFGATAVTTIGRFDISEVLVDDAGVKDAFSVDSSAIAFAVNEPPHSFYSSQFLDCSHRGARLATVPGSLSGQGVVVSGKGNALITFASGYFGGVGSYPVKLTDARVGTFASTVVEVNAPSPAVPGVLVEGQTNNNGRALFVGGSSINKYPEVRGAYSGVDFRRAQAYGWTGSFVFNGLTNAAGAAIVVREDCTLDLSTCALLNGSTNAGRGVDIVGPRSAVKLGASTVVTGTVGDTRVDGISKTYTEINNTRRATTQPGGTLAGVAVVDAVQAATTAGTGTLTFTAAGTTLAYTAPGDTIGAAVNVSGKGYFVLSSNGGSWVRVYVAGTLPVGDTAETFTIARGIYRNDGAAQPVNEIEKL